MLSRAQCSNVEPINSDFLTIDPNDERYRNVTHMYGFLNCFASILLGTNDWYHPFLPLTCLNTAMLAVSWTLHVVDRASSIA